MLGGLLAFFFLTTFGMFLWRQVSLDRAEQVAEERRAELRSTAERNARAHTERMLRTLGVALSHALVAVWSDDAPAERAWSGADSILERVDLEGDLELIAVLGRDGTVVSSSGRRSGDAPRLSAEPGPVGSSDRVRMAWEPPGRYRAVVPLVRAERRIGTLVLVHRARPAVPEAGDEGGSR